VISTVSARPADRIRCPLDKHLKRAAPEFGAINPGGPQAEVLGQPICAHHRHRHRGRRVTVHFVDRDPGIPQGSDTAA